MELSRITCDVNIIFGLQVTMATVSNIILIIYYAYYLFNAVLLSVIISTTSWCIVRFMRVIFVNNVCTTVTEEVIIIIKISLNNN